MSSLLDLPEDVIVSHILPRLEVKYILGLRLVSRKLDELLRGFALPLSVNDSTVGKVVPFGFRTSQSIPLHGLSVGKKFPNFVLNCERPSVAALAVLQPLLDVGKRFAIGPVFWDESIFICLMNSLPACEHLRRSFVDARWNIVPSACFEDVVQACVSFFERSQQILTSLEICDMFDGVVCHPRFIDALALCLNLERLQLPASRAAPDCEKLVRPLAKLTKLTSVSLRTSSYQITDSPTTCFNGALLLLLLQTVGSQLESLDKVPLEWLPVSGLQLPCLKVLDFKVESGCESDAVRLLQRSHLPLLKSLSISKQFDWDLETSLLSFTAGESAILADLFPHLDFVSLNCPASELTACPSLLRALHSYVDVPDAEWLAQALPFLNRVCGLNFNPAINFRMSPLVANATSVILTSTLLRNFEAAAAATLRDIPECIRAVSHLDILGCSFTSSFKALADVSMLLFFWHRPELCSASLSQAG